jgi:hypothetical protein
MTTRQANRAGRPWQRRDGRWAARAYPQDGSKPKMVYGLTEDEVLAKQAEAEAQISTAGGDLPSRPPKPVRFTLDLDQDRHAFLKRFALECGAGTGGAQVMRALLDELAEGANLPMRVRARIQAGKR